MPSFNVAIIMGNLSRDPELRTTPSGTALCTFSVAVNRKYKSQSGQLTEEVSFIDCTAWGITADNIAKYFTKGKPIHIHGRLKQDSWDDKNTGQKRSKLGIVVEGFEFCGGDKNGGDSAPSQRSAYVTPPPAARPPVPPRPTAPVDDPMDDVPF